MLTQLKEEVVNAVAIAANVNSEIVHPTIEIGKMGDVSSKIHLSYQKKEKKTQLR